MNSTHDPDAIIAAWLEDGPLELADPARRSIVTAARAIPQRRGLAAPWRSLAMNSTLKVVAVAVVAIIAAALAGAYLIGRPSNTGGEASPSPSPTATPTASPAPTFSFESSVFQPAFSLSGPNVWRADTDLVDHVNVVHLAAAGGLLFFVVDQAFSDPCMPASGGPDLEIAPGVQPMIDWIAALPRATVGEASEVTYGGFAGQQIDTTTSSLSGCTEANALQTSALHTGLGPQAETGGYPIGPNEMDRWTVLEVDGTTVTIVVWASTADFDAVWADAEPLLETLTFR